MKEKYTTKTKFLEFTGFKGNVNLITDEAEIEGKYFGGLELANLKFKIAIKEDGIEFEEINTNITDKETRKRLVEHLSDYEPIAYRNKMIVPNFIFTTTNQEKVIELYLCVEANTPIQNLAKIFNDYEIGVPTISEEQSSKLDSLFSLFEEYDTEVLEKVVEISEKIEEKSETPTFTSSLEESFKKMKEEKINELKRDIQKQESELKKSKFERNSLDSKIGTIQNELDELNIRLEQIRPELPKNNYCFFVSEKLNESVSLDESTYNTILKTISKVKSINPEAFMNLFKNGEYQIHIGNVSDFETPDFSKMDLIEEVDKKLSNLGLQLVDDKLMYRGEMEWHDLVSFFIKLGFNQVPEYDRKCGSNSYQVGRLESNETNKESNNEINEQDEQNEN